MVKDSESAARVQRKAVRNGRTATWPLEWTAQKSIECLRAPRTLYISTPASPTYTPLLHAPLLYELSTPTYTPVIRTVYPTCQERCAGRVARRGGKVD